MTEATRDVARPSGARAAIGDVAGGEARTRGREARMREATRDVARPSGARAAIGDVAGAEARTRGREDARRATCSNDFSRFRLC